MLLLIEDDDDDDDDEEEEDEDEEKVVLLPLNNDNEGFDFGMERSKCSLGNPAVRFLRIKSESYRHSCRKLPYESKSP